MRRGLPGREGRGPSWAEGTVLVGGKELSRLGVQHTVVAGVEDACGVMEGNVILHQHTEGHTITPETLALHHSDSPPLGVGHP